MLCMIAGRRDSFFMCRISLICSVSRCVCVSSPLGAELPSQWRWYLMTSCARHGLESALRTVCPVFARPTRPPTRKSLGVREQAGGCEQQYACSPVLCFGRARRLAPSLFPYAIIEIDYRYTARGLLTLVEHGRRPCSPRGGVIRGMRDCGIDR